MHHISVADARKVEAVGKHVTLQGWVRTRRDSKGGFSFLEINDGSSQGNVQVIAPAALPNYESEVKHLTAGCSVTITGEVKASPAKGQATEVARRRHHRPRHGRPGNLQAAEEGAHLRVPAHHRPPAAAHQHLRRDRPPAQSGEQVDPRFLPGAGLPLHPAADHHGQRLRRGRRDVQGHDARPGQCAPHRQPLSPGDEGRRVDYTKDFFGRPAYLTVSGQLEAEIFACALGKVYTFGPTFRAENSNTARHLAEFWMVEPEMAFYDLNDNMALAEAFIKRIIRDALDRCAEDMEFFNERIEKGVVERLQGVAD